MIMFLLYIIYIVIMYWNKNLEDYFEGLYRKIRKIPPDQISETESQSLTTSGKFKNGGHGVKSDEKDCSTTHNSETSFGVKIESSGHHEGHKDSKL